MSSLLATLWLRGPQVKSGELKVARGSLARRLRQHVNPARLQVFYEKLVTRRRLNPELAT